MISWRNFKLSTAKKPAISDIKLSLYVEQNHAMPYPQVRVNWYRSAIFFLLNFQLQTHLSTGNSIANLCHDFKKESEMYVQFLMWAHDVPIFRFDLYHPRSIFSFRLPAKFLLIFDFDGFSHIFLMKSLFNWRSSDFYLFILRMSIITSTWWMCDGPGYQLWRGNVDWEVNWEFCWNW